MPEYALVDRLQPGDHVCWTYRDDRARDRILAAYVAAGRREGHKTVYFSHSTPPRQVLSRLAGTGLDVDALVGSGLEVSTADETYLKTGYFDAPAMIEACFAACEQARAEGFAGLRLAGDMSWATGPVAGVERLGWYEAQVTRVYAEGYAIGLCLYDGRLFGADRLHDLRVQHPAAVDADADERWAPLLRVRGIGEATGLRLTGETDLSNRGALVAMLGSLRPSPGGGAPVLDVSALAFADVAAAHAVVVAGARAGGLRVVGASRQFARLLAFVGGDAVPGLVVEQAESLRAPA